MSQDAKVSTGHIVDVPRHRLVSGSAVPVRVRLTVIRVLTRLGLASIIPAIDTAFVSQTDTSNIQVLFSATEFLRGWLHLVTEFAE